jgi:predicted small lipoprotein YifL
LLPILKKYTLSSIILLCISIFTLASCGQKGPLYLPVKPPLAPTNVKQTPAADTAEIEENDQKPIGNLDNKNVR